MRDILFRGKRKENGEWICGDLIHRQIWASSLTIIRETDDGFDNYEEAEVVPETVGQFSGFVDKNGNEIFKGDIVKYSDEECFYPEEYTEFIGEVVFEKGAFGIGSKDELPIDLDYWCDNDNFVSFWELHWNLNCTQGELPMLEVIGNIHDNPNLIKKD